MSNTGHGYAGTGIADFNIIAIRGIVVVHAPEFRRGTGVAAYHIELLAGVTPDNVRPNRITILEFETGKGLTARDVRHDIVIAGAAIVLGHQGIPPSLIAVVPQPALVRFAIIVRTGQGAGVRPHQQTVYWPPSLGFCQPHTYCHQEYQR